VLKRRCRSAFVYCSGPVSTLVKLADMERRLVVLRREQERQAQNALSKERAALEAVHRTSQNELAAWSERHSAEFDRALASVRRLFPNADQSGWRTTLVLRPANGVLAAEGSQIT
jgi:hypothetical protein